MSLLEAVDIVAGYGDMEILHGVSLRVEPGEIVQVRVDLAAGLDKTVNELAAIPEVEEVHLITGEYDLVVKVRARDTVHLQELLLTRLHKVPGFVRSATEVCLTSPLERHGPLVKPD